MASNLAKCRDKHMVYCTINTSYERHWRDFTLQKGHLYGYSPDLDGIDGLNGMFVVYREKRDRIELYACSPVLDESSNTTDHYHWRKYAIEKQTRTGREIMRVLGNRIGVVEFRPVWQQDTRHVYNPPLMKTKYTPMPNMRIPGGSYKNVYAEVHHFPGMGKPIDHEAIVLKNIEDAKIHAQRRLAATV